MNKNKKGFTIVELVIVIAIIAILAAILIPTFANIIRTAHISADTQLIRNLNTALTVDSAKNGKHTTMQSALDAAESAGYLVGRINASATQNEILWDSKNDMFCYLDKMGTADENDDVITYIPETTLTYPVNEGSTYDDTKVNNVDYWVISSTFSADTKYSTYYTGTETTITTTKGFDAGKSSVASITYDRHEATEGQTVVIRTNGGTLTVNAPVDTVKHYGDATVLNIEAVATSSYHEFGTVANAQIKTGRIVIENSEASIDNLLLIAKSDKSGFEDIVVETKTGAELPTLDRTDVIIADNGTLVLNVVTPSTDEYIYLTKAGVIEQIVVTNEIKNDVSGETANVASKSETTQAVAEQVANVGTKNEDGNYVDSNGDVIALEDLTSENVVIAEAKADNTKINYGKNYFSGGAGTEKSPFLIASEKDWETLATWSTKSKSHFGATGYSYKVVNDLDMSYLNSADDFYKFCLYYFHGTIDFDNHQMTWMTPYSTATYCLILYSYNGCTIKNANFNLSDGATIIYGYINDQNIVLQNINIYGNIVAYNSNFYAPFYAYWMKASSKLTMINCNNYCNITSSADNTGIFVGRTYGASTSNIWYYDIELINCNNYGTLINASGNAGMLFSNANTYFDASRVTVENCGNYGTIIGKTNANLICGNLDKKYYDTTNANYDSNNNVEGLDVSNKQNGVCGKASISTLNVDENGNFVLPQTVNAEYYSLSFVTTYNDGGGATTGITYRITEEQRAALNLKAYEFSVGEGSNSTTGATPITVGDGTLYVKDEKYLFINQTPHMSDRYITRQPTVSFMAFDENGNLLAAYNYTYSN